MSDDKSLIPSQAAAPSLDKERGSALIISMMVMVILTMLGVTFAVLAQQEEKISVNARDHQQVLYAAEAAVELAKTWFNDPSSANALRPASNQMNYATRRGAIFADTYLNENERDAPVNDSIVDGSAGNTYTGGNLTGAAVRFDKPYRGSYANSFWGRPATPDVLLCGDSTLDIDGGGADCNATMKQYIDKLNRSILMSSNLTAAGHSSRDFGNVQIEQIRVYRPPIDFSLKTRYGIATIEATAIKTVRGQVVARRTVREVLQEIPFPGPNGAIESEGEISANGSAGVHWGSVVSSATNDDILLPNVSNNSPDASVARQTSARFGFHASINPASFGNYGGVAVSGDPTIANWVTEALGITRRGVRSTAYTAAAIGDPWLLFRARRRIVIGGVNNTPTNQQPYPWTSTTDVPANGQVYFDKKDQSNWSHMFQSQIVRFPPIDYQTWKDVAQSGQQGMYYFQWVNGTNYKRDGRGTAQSFTTWLTQFQKGVFFFDTKDSTKPHDVGTASSNLTPTHGWGTNMYVEGFIYLNSATFDSSGAGGGTAKECNMPGEPFLDDGIDLHATGQTAGDDCLCIRYDAEDGCVLGVRPIGYGTCTGVEGDDCVCDPTTIGNVNASAASRAVAQREADTFRNGIWDSDIDNDGVTDANGDITTLGAAWTNFKSANTGAGDGFTGGHGYAQGVLPSYPVTPSTTRYKQGQNTLTARDWKRDPRFLNHMGESGLSTTVGRQVYEPFLNFDSPTNGATVESWANNHNLTVNFQAEGEVVEKDSSGTVTKSTTRARDATGALMSLDLHINGVFYCEGTYTGTGNLKVYGSLLMRGGYSGTGSVDVWFNEDLVKGRFPPPSWKLPRVYASARDTN